MKDGPVVVAGGGPAGVYAAWRLAREGLAPVVLERENFVGGLSAALRHGGNVYGHGFHALHDPDDAFLRDVRGPAGPAAREFPRSVAIKLRGRFHDYPLRLAGALAGFTPGELGRGLLGFLGAAALSPFRRGEPADSEEAVVRLYGRSLYRTYFSEYTDRFWGRPASAISARFAAERLPRFDPAEKLRRLWPGARGARATEIGRPTMWTTASGTGTFFEAMAEDARSRGAEVRTGCDVEEVILESGRAVGLRVRRGGASEEVPCAALISTLPLGDLAARIRPLPPARVLEAAAGLGRRGLLTVGLLVRRPRLLPRGLVYFHGRAFHRLSEPGQTGVEVRPEGRSVLLAERTADPGDREWEDRGSLIDAVVRGLEDEGLARADEIEEARVAAAPDAYPLYALGFEAKREAVRDFVAAIPNLVSTGRQGRFAFLRSAESMRAAWADARSLLDRIG